MRDELTKNGIDLTDGAKRRSGDKRESANYVQFDWFTNLRQDESNQPSSCRRVRLGSHPPHRARILWGTCLAGIAKGRATRLDFGAREVDNTGRAIADRSVNWPAIGQALARFTETEILHECGRDCC